MATNSSTIATKAQHYVPKFYLKGFTDKQNALWVYEKFKPLRESKPKKEAHRPDYYTHRESGQRDETAEDALKAAESRAAPIINKLANHHYVLTPENAAYVIVFVAFMFARVPSWREYLDTVSGRLMKQNQMKIAGDMERFHRFYAGFETIAGKPLGMSCEELRQYILKGEYDIEQKSAAYNLGAMFRSVLTITQILQDFGYEGLYAPEGKSFLTSDSPVYTLQPDGKGQATVGVGFGWPGVEVYFPLNKRTCLRMKKGLKPKGRFIDNGHIEEINRLTMANAAKFLYASERSRRISRLFDERGCKVLVGESSFLATPPTEERRLF